jgi:hypothetical protein
VHLISSGGRTNEHKHASTSMAVADGEPKGLTPRLPPSHRQFVSIGWFNSLSIQYSQTLLTLFSKSFSSFPRGTCALSDSVVY